MQVSKDDQQRINEFGRLNSRKHEIKDEIAEAKVIKTLVISYGHTNFALRRLQKRLEEVTDAEEGIMLADESEPGALK